jgi:meiotically up-regulated gene 157 (Mug157) protein
MLAVELDHIAEMLEELNVHQNISSKSRAYSKTIRQAVWDHTITSKGIFAYETDGFGGQIIMDDGNVPVRQAPYPSELEKLKLTTSPSYRCHT